MALLVGVLARLGEGLRGRERRRLWRQGEVEEGKRNRLLLHSGSLPRVVLLAAGSVLHFDARVHRLVPPQVVAVLELFIAGGTDVGRPARFDERFDWRTNIKTLVLRYFLKDASVFIQVNAAVYHCSMVYEEECVK